MSVVRSSSPRRTKAVWRSDVEPNTPYTRRPPNPMDRKPKTNFINILKTRYPLDGNVGTVTLKGVRTGIFDLKDAPEEVLNGVRHSKMMHCQGDVSDSYIEEALLKNKMLVVVYMDPNVGNSGFTVMGDVGKTKTMVERNATARTRSYSILGFMICDFLTKEEHQQEHEPMASVQNTALPIGKLLEGVMRGEYTHHYEKAVPKRVGMTTRSNKNPLFSYVRVTRPTDKAVDRLKRQVEEPSDTSQHIVYVDVICSNASRGKQLLAFLENVKFRMAVKQHFNVSYDAISLSSLRDPYSLYASLGFLRTLDFKVVYPLYVIKSKDANKKNAKEVVYLVDESSSKDLIDKQDSIFFVYRGEKRADNQVYYMTKFIGSM